VISPLAAAAIVTYKFRTRRPHEPEAEYLGDLVQHVEQRDFAAAHELRVGRRQADWTKADVQAFHEHLNRRGWHGPSEDLPPGVTVRPALEIGIAEVSEAGLLAYATEMLDALVDLRKRRPTGELWIAASVVLTDGRALATFVSRGDRVAVIKALARTQPVFGFVVACDVFIHGIDTRRGEATKQDAIIAHVGTREIRLIKVRPYALEHGQAVFVDPPPPDIDKAAEVCSDPYAGIFVTVPPPTGPPS